ncbi:hypothetical protein EMPG_13296 [Blastomyces silverae]|uniref:C2H2-type domain-containing protein n=1 Tax=Blastomyces silverae TaxID=2060906 RepID=A0A0H1BQR7_9EURO|nr:hypothetical protein EMPG_13296 [Blastomyces silverae]
MTLYPRLDPDLRESLVASMTRRYAATLHSRCRQSTEADPCTPMIINRDGSNKYRVPNKSHMAKGERAKSMRDSTKADSRFQQIRSYQFHQDNYPSPPEKGNADTITCEWCSTVLTRETLEPSNWRRHVDADLLPYMCIADECPESHPLFSEFDDWLNHMQGHGHDWYRQVFHLMSWVCLLCTPPKLEFYIDSQRLLAHMNDKHSEDCTKEECEATARNSIKREPTPNKCRLCLYEIGKTVPPGHLYSRKRRRQPLQEMEGKSARVDLEMRHPKPHTSIDDPSLDFDGTAESFDSVQGSPGPKASKTMALHVAGHLQMLMLLTVRLASIQNDQETLIDDINSDSVNVDIGDRSSLAENLAMLSDIDLHKANEEEPLDEADASDLDVDPHVKTLVPDTEELNDWSDILPPNFPPEEDKFLQEVVKSGAYQSHHQVRFISLRRDLGLPPRLRTHEKSECRRHGPMEAFGFESWLTSGY